MRLCLSITIAVTLVTSLVFAADNGSGVEAFIPQLTPLNRTEPIYPNSARERHISGIVQVLATIDPVGHVVEVEVLAGPDTLRQAAVDAVKQWSFRPVLRNGRPVSAITEQTVPFLIPGVKLPVPDIAETLTVVQRVSRLKKQFPRDDAQALTDSEQQASGESGEQFFYSLTKLAKSALVAGDDAKAAGYAAQLLAIAPQYPDDWNYGNAIHTGNMILGRVSLHKGDVASARQYLLQSGHTPGSPQLNSFGPNVSLAKELILANERDTALQYFDLCRSFWKLGGDKLDAWTAVVRAGGVPDFGPNLLY